MGFVTLDIAAITKFFIKGNNPKIISKLIIAMYDYDAQSYFTNTERYSKIEKRIRHTFPKWV